MTEAADDLFARWVTRLEQVTLQLKGLRRDYAQTQSAKITAKSDVYQANMNLSHAERQGMASAQTATLDADSLVLKAEIDVLEDERQMLELLIQNVSA